MSKVASKSSLIELKEESDVVISTDTSISLRIDDDDFVCVENAPSEDIEDNLDSSDKADAGMVNIAQHGTNTESSGNAEELLFNNNIEDTECGEIIPSEWDRGVLVEHQYWKRYGSSVQRLNKSGPKYPASQRLTVKEIDKIEMHKTACRDPSSFQLNISTTAILHSLIDNKSVKTYHNVLGKGKYSVVIHASIYNDNFKSGVAVKVYKLSNDVQKNSTILKRADREYEHLQILKYFAAVPSVEHRMKNVTILSFFGDNRESAPPISEGFPSQHVENLYQVIVHYMTTWYTKYNIVHGKLCANNIIYTTLDPHHVYCYPFALYIIGWTGSVKRDHPRALIKLFKDCHFVSNFFTRRGVPGVKSREDLFQQITKLDKINSNVANTFCKKDLWQKGHLSNPNRVSN